MRVPGIDGGDFGRGGRTRIDDRRRPGRERRDKTGAMGHAAVGDGGAVFDHQHALAMYRCGIVQAHRHGPAHDRRTRIGAARAVHHLLHRACIGGIGLRQQHDVGHAQDRLARVIGGFVARAQRVDQHDMQVGAHEREIVVAAVPEDQVGIAPGRLDDADVVDTGIDDVAGGEMRLVLFAFFDGAGRAVEVGAGFEALHALAHEIAVRHGVAHDGGAQAAYSQFARQPAAHRRLAAAGAHRRYRDHRHARRDHGALRAEQREIGPGGERARSDVHDFGMGEIAVGEHDLFHLARADQRLEFRLGHDRNALGIERAGERGRIAASGDAGNLGRGKRHDLERRIVAIDDVEVVEIAAGRADDHDARAVGSIQCALTDPGGTPARLMRFMVRMNITDYSPYRPDPANCGSPITPDCAMSRVPLCSRTLIVRGRSSTEIRVIQCLSILPNRSGTRRWSTEKGNHRNCHGRPYGA